MSFMCVTCMIGFASPVLTRPVDMGSMKYNAGGNNIGNESPADLFV